MARPRNFDEEQVLDAAVTCFWERGYEVTSVRDLSVSMGISAPSLYNAFGDKRTLFARALDHYCATRTYRLLAKIEAENTPADAIAERSSSAASSRPGRQVLPVTRRARALPPIICSLC